MVSFTASFYFSSAFPFCFCPTYNDVPQEAQQNNWGRSGGAMALGKLPIVLAVGADVILLGQGPIALAVGAGVILLGQGPIALE